MSRLVLIVEDNETCAETLTIALERIPNIEVRSIHTSVAALDFLASRDGEIAALVTDLHLPKNGESAGDGLDLIRRIRAEARFARLPIVLISGDSDPQVRERALAHGADAFFPKPYSPAAVRRKLEELLC